MDLNENYQNSLPQIQEVLDKEGVVTLFNAFTKINLSKTNLKKSKNPLTHSYSSSKTILPTNLKEFLEKLTQSKSKTTTLYQLKHKDYTILNDDNLTKSNYNILIDLTKNWQPEWGGTVTYTDGEGNIIQIPTEYNSITILNTQNLQRYIKYINNLAQNNKRKLIIIEL